MNSIRKMLAASLLTAAVLATAAAGISIATATAAAAAAAADDVAASTAPAGGRDGWHHPHHHGHGEWMLSQLNLSDAQKEQIKAVMTAAHPQMQSIHEEMRANSLKLSNTAPNDPSYASVVSEVSQANSALHAQMITQKEKVRASVFNLLTAAQQQQLATLKTEMRAKLQQRQAE